MDPFFFVTVDGRANTHSYEIIHVGAFLIYVEQMGTQDR